MSEKAVIKEIARPRFRLPIVNVPTILLRDRGLLAAVNYSGTGKDANLFLVNVEKMEDERYRLPEGEKGAYGFVRGTDGKLYLGTFSGRLYSFDLDQREFQEIAHPFTDGQMIWGGGASSLGKVYMGVYPTGEFCEYDINTGSLKMFRPMPKENLGFYARQFLELPDEKVLIGIGGASPNLLIYDPRTEEYQKVYSWSSGESPFMSFECFFDEERLVVNLLKGGGLKLFNWRKKKFEGPFLREAPEPVWGLVKVRDVFYGLGYSSARVYRIEDGQIEVAQEEFPYGNRLSRIHHLKGDEFIGLSNNGLFIRFNLSTNEFSSFQIHNESDNGMSIQMLEKIPGKDWVIGSHYINMQIFKIDLKNHSCQSSLNKISRYGGQVNCGTYYRKKGVFYLASYVRAVLYALYPEEPFKYGVNPRMIGEVGQQQNRPVEMTSDDRYVYLATKADYGTLGGAITVFDPETEKWEVYRNFVKDQNPTSLFYHRPTGCLVGTTEVFADCRSGIPTAQNAVVFVWDTKKRKTIHTSYPWKTEQLIACALSPGGKLIGFGDDKYFLFDLNTRKYEIRKWPGKRVNWYWGVRGSFAGNRYFYGATEEDLFRLDVETDKVVTLAKTSGTMLVRKVSEKQFLFDQEGSVKMLVIS